MNVSKSPFFAAMQVLQEELRLAKESVQTSVSNHVSSAAPAEVRLVIKPSNFNYLLMLLLSWQPVSDGYLCYRMAKNLMCLPRPSKMRKYL